jgi:prepilin-type N-terminal cleavage/methylation domain-containing protein
MEKRHNSPGFTLLEIIVALAIMATAVTVLIQLFGSSLQSASVAKDYNEGIRLAGYILEKALNSEDLDETYEESGYIDEGHRWEIKCLDYLLPEFSRKVETPMKIVRVLVIVWWGGKEIELSSLKLIKE